ncbi:MAG: metal ABC transporter solute-binding protein, Zn/Mn family [Cetobacterium sp.]
MKKKLIITAMVILGLFTVVGCSTKENKNETGKLRVGVTINPLKEFAEMIGGDKVEVFSIIPNGSDPHNFDPKPKDMKSLHDSDIFIYNGLNMEDWIESVLNTIDKEDIQIVNSSDGVTVIELSEEDHSEETEEEHADHDHGSQDPHIWLSLKEASKQAENIKDALALKDPDNKDYYEANFEKLKKDFDELYNEYAEKFKTVSNKDFVTGHAAFGYLCRDFGLTQNSIADIYGEGELTSKNLETLINYCKQNNVKTIFSESASSSSEAETLARESGAKVQKIYSLESNEDNMSYLEGTRYNYEKIYEALK